MQYEAMAAREYKTAREMRAAHSETHRKFFDTQALEISEQCDRDHKTILSLRGRVRRQLAEIARLIDETKGYQQRIEELRSKAAEDEAEVRRLAGVQRATAVEIRTAATTVNFRQVLAAACKVYKLAPQVIKSPSRDRRSIAARRHIVHILTTQRADLSIPLIGRLLCRDHTTILHARNSWPKAAPFLQREIVEMDRLLFLEQTVDRADRS